MFDSKRVTLYSNDECLQVGEYDSALENDDSALENDDSALENDDSSLENDDLCDRWQPRHR